MDYVARKKNMLAIFNSALLIYFCSSCLVIKLLENKNPVLDLILNIHNACISQLNIIVHENTTQFKVLSYFLIDFHSITLWFWPGTVIRQFDST